MKSPHCGGHPVKYFRMKVIRIKEQLSDLSVLAVQRIVSPVLSDKFCYCKIGQQGFFPIDENLRKVWEVAKGMKQQDV